MHKQTTVADPGGGGGNRRRPPPTFGSTMFFKIKIVIRMLINKAQIALKQP